MFHFLFRLNELPVYKETKIIKAINAIQRICVPSSRFAVVEHGEKKYLSLIDLSTSSDVVTPLQTFPECGIHGMAAISKNKIAITHFSNIVFYDICDEKLVALVEETIDLKEICLGIDYYNQTLFVTNYDKIKQIDMNGTVLRCFNVGLEDSEEKTPTPIAYNPITERIYFAKRHGLFSMTLEGKITEIETDLSGIHDLTVTTFGDFYLAASDSIYKINLDTREAIKFETSCCGYGESKPAPLCMAFDENQKVVYVAFQDYIEIFETNKSKEPKSH